MAELAACFEVLAIATAAVASFARRLLTPAAGKVTWCSEVVTPADGTTGLRLTPSIMLALASLIRGTRRSFFLDSISGMYMPQHTTFALT
jgi:hypothetical protein